VEILAARRRLTAPPAPPRPPTGRPAGDERAAASAWLSSLPSPERDSLRTAHRITGNPYDRLEDWPVRAWRAAGRPQPLGGQVVMPCSASESGVPRADRDALSWPAGRNGHRGAGDGHPLGSRPRFARFVSVRCDL